MNQSSIERILHPYHIKQDCIQELKESFPNEISKAKKVLDKWLSIKEYESKQARKDILVTQDKRALILEILHAACTSTGLPLVSVSSLVSLPVFNKYDSIKTAAELLALFEPIGLYEIVTENNRKYIYSLVEFDTKLANRMNLTCHMPPMIEKPNKIKHNASSTYKTISRDNLILGHQLNRHKYPLAYDVVNTLNSTGLELDMYVYTNFNKEADDTYKEQLDTMVSMLKDKTLYFPHKFDKRGRIYCKGYHFNTQGSSYEKALLNLSNKELITGEL